nr:MAG TPA: hypothetical protein [Caudoviricetes sp.]
MADIVFLHLLLVNICVRSVDMWQIVAWIHLKYLHLLLILCRSLLFQQRKNSLLK